MTIPLRVLLVEDLESDAQLLLLELRRGGYQPVALRVDSAAAMLDALEGQDWDVVISDHSMPHFSAPTALEILKKSGLDLPFIVVSGVIGEETAVALMKAGAHDYLVKGNLARLAPAVQRELREAEVRHDRRRAEEEIKRLNEDLERRVVERTAQLAAANERLEREAAELERLHDSMRKLADSSQRQARQLDTIVESIADAVLVCDARSDITLANSVALRLMGKERGTPLGSIADYMDTLQLCFLDGRQVPLDDLAIARALHSGEVIRGREEKAVHPKTRQRVDLFISAAPLHDEQGHIVGAVEVATDITELRVLQERQKEYVGLISHDLRTPLTAVIGMAQILQRGIQRQETDRVAQNADAILKNAKRMATMIADLVETVQLEAGQLEMPKEPVDLLRVLSEAVEHVGTPEDRARVQLEVSERVAPVLGDARHLDRAVTNLLTNALKYSPPDSTVVIRIVQQNGSALVSFSDQGVGISREDLPHIFERHFRAKTAGKREGLGLGLYITRLIVEAHGGRVCAESEVGKGSTFFLALPQPVRGSAC